MFMPTPRQPASLAGTRLVAVTGWGQEQDRQRSLEAGFNDHLIKPASMEDLEKLMVRSGPSIKSIQ